MERGITAATPATTVMNSRRRIGTSEGPGPPRATLASCDQQAGINRSDVRFGRQKRKWLHSPVRVCFTPQSDMCSRDGARVHCFFQVLRSAPVVPGPLSTAMCSGLPIPRRKAHSCLMTTKSREHIYGSSIRAKAERAAEARKEADSSPARPGTCGCWAFRGRRSRPLSSVTC